MVGRVSRKGIDGYLGIRVTEVEAGRLVAEMPVTDEVITIMGNMHGGCLSAMCDHVLGVVMYPVMPAGSWAATTEFKINLLAPVSGGTCTATSEIVSMSKRLAVVRIQIENEDRLVALAQGTCTIVAPRSS
ncbi:MAG: PaaI family thioesterase [Acidimicrobiales bacterium]